jgi:hypothetical protein
MPSRLSKTFETGCLGAVIVGVVAFAIGFVGPIIFMPESNQGPLLGIFITGPLGAITGAVIGAVVGWRRSGARS